jgi:site-specific DNA recombinase
VQVKRAIIYTRVSHDPSREARSVGEQEQECRAECARNGWDVGLVVTDNDRSASRFAKRDRPGFQRLWKVLRPGDILVVWESSRAQRDLRDYIELRDLCAERGVLLSYSGRIYDLTEGDDRFTTGLDALIAERYSEEHRKRILRAQRTSLAAGKPHGRVPFGYKILRDEQGRALKRVPDPHTAPIVAELFTRVLAGDTLYSIAEDFNERSVPMHKGRTGAWSQTALRDMVTRPTYAGLRTHRGEVTGPGDWQPIITEEDWRAACKIVNSAHRRINLRGNKPKYLLSGIALCGVCGSPVRRVKGRFEGYPDVYVCAARSRCVSRHREEVDAVVTGILLKMLADPRLRQALASAGDEHDPYGEIAALRERLAGFRMAAVEGKISPESFADIEAQLNEKIAAEREKAASAAMDPLLAALVGVGAETVWEQFSLEQKRQVVRTALVVSIEPVGKIGRRKFDVADTVKVAWRVSGA